MHTLDTHNTLARGSCYAFMQQLKSMKPSLTKQEQNAYRTRRGNSPVQNINKGPYKKYYVIDDKEKRYNTMVTFEKSNEKLRRSKTARREENRLNEFGRSRLGQEIHRPPIECYRNVPKFNNVFSRHVDNNRRQSPGLSYAESLSFRFENEAMENNWSSRDAGDSLMYGMEDDIFYDDTIYRRKFRYEENFARLQKIENEVDENLVKGRPPIDVICDIESNEYYKQNKNQNSHVMKDNTRGRHIGNVTAKNFMRTRDENVRNEKETIVNQFGNDKTQYSVHEHFKKLQEKIKSTLNGGTQSNNNSCKQKSQTPFRSTIKSVADNFVNGIRTVSNYIPEVKVVQECSSCNNNCICGNNTLFHTSSSCFNSYICDPRKYPYRTKCRCNIRSCPNNMQRSCSACIPCRCPIPSTNYYRQASMSAHTKLAQNHNNTYIFVCEPTCLPKVLDVLDQKMEDGIVQVEFDKGQVKVEFDNRHMKFDSRQLEVDNGQLKIDNRRVEFDNTMQPDRGTSTRTKRSLKKDVLKNLSRSDGEKKTERLMRNATAAHNSKYNDVLDWNNSAVREYENSLADRRAQCQDNNTQTSKVFRSQNEELSKALEAKRKKLCTKTNARNREENSKEYKVRLVMSTSERTKPDRQEGRKFYNRLQETKKVDQKVQRLSETTSSYKSINTTTSSPYEKYSVKHKPCNKSADKKRWIAKQAEDKPLTAHPLAVPSQYWETFLTR